MKTYAKVEVGLRHICELESKGGTSLKGMIYAHLMPFLTWFCVPKIVCAMTISYDGKLRG